MVDQHLARNEFKVDPNGWNSFRQRGDLLGLLNNKSQADLVEATAVQRGFEYSGSLKTKRGVWVIYNRQPTNIPNFYLDDSVVHSSLGVYRPKKSPDKAVALLRSSLEEVVTDEFIRDVRTLDKTRINPPILSFHYEYEAIAIVKGMVAAIPGAIAGAGAVFGIGPSAGPDTYLTAIGIGSMLGVLAWYIPSHSNLMERQRQLSSGNDYFINSNAQTVLAHEQSHIAQVQLLRELYGSIGGEQRISPERFLAEGFANLPSKLTTPMPEGIGFLA
ncbi:MAG: hypothetical protein EPN86_06170 [Nanoarchaeota archaeon]|nr:MAG: hypothetical protein EPN86_06170 [Nanoarchaeota archaeon]